MKMPKNIGEILLAAFLIGWGADVLLKIGSHVYTIVLAIVAIAAGVLMLMGRR